MAYIIIDASLYLAEIMRFRKALEVEKFADGLQVCEPRTDGLIA